MTIDTHHYILPDFFWQATENADAPVGGLAPLQWSTEASISFMDDAGIDIAVVSLSTPRVHTGDSARARALARRCWDAQPEALTRKRRTMFARPSKRSGARASSKRPSSPSEIARTTCLAASRCPT